VPKIRKKIHKKLSYKSKSIQDLDLSMVRFYYEASLARFTMGIAPLSASPFGHTHKGYFVCKLRLPAILAYLVDVHASTPATLALFRNKKTSTKKPDKLQ